MGEALHGGHEMLNHLGKVIRVTRRTIRALDPCATTCDAIAGAVCSSCVLSSIPLFKELERGDRHGGILRELGDDCSGPNVPICHCRQCSSQAADLDHTRLSDEYRRVKTDEVIKAVKSKRRRR